MREPKKECFAYQPAKKAHGRAKCAALLKLECRYSKCPFYKTREEVKDGDTQ